LHKKEIPWGINTALFTAKMLNIIMPVEENKNEKNMLICTVVYGLGGRTILIIRPRNEY
jgi:hypothetical protein